MKTRMLCLGTLLMGFTLLCSCGDSDSVSQSADSKCGDKSYDPDKQLCDDRDNRVYNYVVIAPKGSGYSKSWMAENLRYSTEEGSFCEGALSEDGDKSFDCDKYGRLYTWPAAVGKSESECGEDMDCNLGSERVRGVCPKGWHLPSEEEWNELVVAVDEKITDYSFNNNAGIKLKSKSGWIAESEDDVRNGLDSYGFTALAAGDWDCHGEGYYDDEGYDAFFWTSTEFSSGRAYYVVLYNELDDDGNDAVVVESSSKRYGFSVRCVKDD